MKLCINSVRINGYKIKIFSNEELLFEGYQLSNPKNNIELKCEGVGSLRFEYRFLSKREIKELSADIDKSSDTNVYAYNPLDMIEEKGCPTPGEMLYTTVITNIPEETECIKLLFRRSMLNEYMPVLAVMERMLRDQVQVTYERNKDYKRILLKSKKKAYGCYVLKSIVLLAILLLLLYSLSVHCPRWYIIIPIGIVSAYEILVLKAKIKHYMFFYRRVEQIVSFQHEDGELKIVNEV